MSVAQAKPKPSARRHHSPIRSPHRMESPAGGFAAPVADRPLGSFYQAGPALSLGAGMGAVQMKLAVGRPGDPFEREADTAAERISAGESAPAITPLGPGALSGMAPVQTQPVEEEEETAFDEEEIVQPCACEESSTAEEENVQACACEEEQMGTVEPPRVQRQAEDEEDPTAVQPAAQSSATAVPTNGHPVSSAIRNPGAGAPLAPPMRGRLESGLGADLSEVRVHSDGPSRQAARALKARAFTHGRDIWLGPGESADDQKLLAHEATHVVQQGRGQSSATVQRRDVPSEAEAEQEEDTFAIQPQLRADATRNFDIATGTDASADTGGQITPTAAPAQDESTEESEAPAEEKTDASAAEEGGDTAGSPDSVESASPPSGESGGGSTETSRTDAAACAGGGVPTCYTGERERPAQEPEDVPENPPPTDVEKETDDSGEEDGPEPDKCPPVKEQTTPAPGAPPGPAPVAANGAAPVAGSGSPAPTPGAGAGGPVGAEGAGAAGPSPAGGPAGGGPESGADGGSPMETTISLAESGRADAVSAYEGSSAALADTAQTIPSLRRGTQFAQMPGEGDSDDLRHAAATRADQFFGQVADRLDAAAALAAGAIPDQLGRDAESAKQELATSMESQKKSISQRIQQAKGRARADASTAQRLVSGQTSTFQALIKTKTKAAIDALTKTHGEAGSQVTTLETTTLDGINEIYAKGRTDLEGLGVTVGAECITTGNEFAAKYEDFKDCTDDAWYDGNLSERRALAQAKAAREVSRGHQERIVESAKKRAKEITKQGRTEDRCAVIASANQTRESLDKQLADLKTALESARDESIRQSNITRDGLIASIKASLTSTLRQLERQETEQLQLVDDTRYVQQLLQEQTAHAAASAVQEGVRSAVATTQSAISTLQQQFADNRAPDLETLDETLSIVEGRINAALGGLDESAEGGATAASDQLKNALQKGLDALKGVTQSNDELATTVSDDFSASMRTMGRTDHFAQQRAGFTQRVEKSTADGTSALNKAVDAMREGCDKTSTEAKEKLVKAGTDLEKNLRQSKEGLECQITQKADEAASKEAPAWKKVLAVVLIIIVIVIVIAVTIATAGGALAGLGFFATVAAGAAIGAAVGAVTSGLIAIAGNLWSNRDWTKGVGEAILVGAITGAIGGAVGAGVGFGVGLALKGASSFVQVSAQLGAAMVTAGGLDVVTQYVMGGFSFDNFSWTNLGMTLVITIITFGIGHRAGVRAQARAASAAPEPTTSTRTTPDTTPEATPTPSTTPEATPTPSTTPELTPPAPPTPEPVPATPPRRSTVSAGPEGIVEHPTSIPEVINAPRRGGSRPVQEPTTPDPVPPRSSREPRRGSTSEEILDVLNEQTRTSPATDQGEHIIHGDDVREQMNPRTSESTTRAEREAATLRGERERAARRAPLEDDPAQVLPEERPPGNLFDDPNAPAPRAGELYERPALRQGTRDTIEASAPKNAQGEFIDAKGNVIQDPHYGHIRGHEHRRIVAAADELGLTQTQLNDYVNSRPEFFQIEEGPINLSHRDELPGLHPYDHIVLDMINFFNL
jgi:hypothetical protein